MKNKITLHKASFWILNIVEFIIASEIANSFNNPNYGLKDILLIVLLILIGIVYYSWWELYRNSFKG